MTLHLPGDAALVARLKQPDQRLALCFCAAWCDACKAYKPKLEVLASQNPDICFVWIDIEDHPDLLGDEDVENFPTIGILDGRSVRFMGTILPHIEHLERLLEAMRAPGKTQACGLPENLMSLLAHG
jgi:thiol-disulfide isomerase/thioredoxin